MRLENIFKYDPRSRQPRVYRLGHGVLLLAASLFFACGPKKIQVSTAARTHPNLAKKSLGELTSLFNRKASRGSLHLSVTLWDRAFIEAFLKRRAAKKSWSRETLNKAVSDWTAKFVQGKTSFRVRLEALNRPLTVQGQDPVLELQSWRWELWDSSGNHIKVSEAQTETKKVFGGTKGRQSFRVDGNIHFNYTITPNKTAWIQLLAFPPDDQKAIPIKRWYLKP